MHRIRKHMSIVGSFRWCKFQKEFSVLIFVERMYQPHSYQLIATPLMLTWQLKETAKQRLKQAGATTAIVEPTTFTKVSGQLLWVRKCWTEGFSATDLNFGSFGASLIAYVVSILYSNMMILLYCSYLEGRWTVEDYLVHVALVRIDIHTHMANITSSVSSSVRFFIFAGVVSLQSLW